jgi:hypothetical protein
MIRNYGILGYPSMFSQTHPTAPADCAGLRWRFEQLVWASAWAWVVVVLWRLLGACGSCGMWLPGVSVVMGVVTFHNGILLQKPGFFFLRNLIYSSRFPVLRHQRFSVSVSMSWAALLPSSQEAWHCLEMSYHLDLGTVTSQNGSGSKNSPFEGLRHFWLFDKSQYGFWGSRFGDNLHFWFFRAFLLKSCNDVLYRLDIWIILDVFFAAEDCCLEVWWSCQH